MSLAWAIVLCASSVAVGSLAQEGAVCPRYGEPEVVGTLVSAELAEVSGVAASRAHPGFLYVHNDSGEPYARFFAIRSDGSVVAEYRLGRERARDLEEIALGPGARPGSSAIYLADVGDNDARAGRPPRASIVVFRVAEPDPSAVAPTRAGPRTIVLRGHERFELRYPARSYDCEAILVDPSTGDLYLLGKVAEGPAPLFRARAPLSTRSVTTLEALGEVLPARNLGDSITAASVDATGTRIVVRTYRSALLFSRAEGQSWLDALSVSPTVLPRLREPQGEAISFLDASGTIVSITEGARAPVQVLRNECAPGR